jgi:amphi-Trp domain-containing protein
MPNNKRRRARELQATYSKKALAGELRRLAYAFANGRPCVFLIKGVRIVIPVHASVTMEYEREGRQEEMEIEVQWRRAGRRQRTGR